jgi:hypothetical protein
MVTRNNWLEDVVEEVGEEATSEQIAAVISRRPEFLAAIQRELKPPVATVVAGPTLSQRIGQAIADAMTSG